LENYGYFWDTSRPTDFQSGWTPFSEWTEIRAQEQMLLWTSTYTVGAGPLNVGAQLSQLDQLDGQSTNDLTGVQINSAPASARVSLHQSVVPPNPSVGYIALFVTEIRNEGPDRVTGLCLQEANSENLELTLNSAVTGVSGEFVTWPYDNLVRLPPLEP